MTSTLLNALIANADSLYFYVLFLSEPKGTLGLRRLVFKRPETKFVSEGEAELILKALSDNLDRLAEKPKVIEVFVSLQSNLIEGGLNPELVLERRTNNEKLAQAFYRELSVHKKASA